MKIKAILPCAGYGTRMNMLKNKSKELLLDPRTKKPLIQWHLELCKKHNLDPIIVTRKEKKDLINYCKKNKIEYKIIDIKGEWMDSVLAVHEKFQFYNILLLPDTKFSTPDFVIKNIKQSLFYGSNICFGLHKPLEIKNWGSVSKWWGCEKSTNKLFQYAWGIIGFSNIIANDLFMPMKQKDKYFKLPDTPNFIFIDHFYDLTRTGKVEYKKC